MKMKLIPIYPPGLLLLISLISGIAFAQTQVEMTSEEREARMRGEESRDYYDNWLREDVAYIATGAEKEIFRSLTTPEEKEQFIEQFWIRRDPDPRTAR